MKQCCEDKAEALQALERRHSRTIKLVLAINAVMFAVEAGAGVAARSTALLGDSLDMLGDALVYGATLHAFTRGPLAKARAAVLKGSVMLALGALVLVEAVSKVLGGAVPHANTMGTIGLLALAANVTCLLVLFRHRADDINMSSAWICSRNDIVANVAVVAAAVAVGAFGSRWPDVFVGVGIAVLFVVSAVGVLGEGARALRLERSGAIEPTRKRR